MNLTSARSDRPSEMDTEPHDGFPELSVVSLIHALTAETIELPAGARGTVVHVYGNGLAYEIEFFDPEHALVTVEASSLKLQAIY